MKKLNTSLIGIMTLSIAACSFVKLNSNAQNVTVQPQSNTFANCKSLGSTTASLWSKASTFQSDEKMESELDTLARNEAATMGGNTVVAESEITNGQRSYKVYNCPTQ